MAASPHIMQISRNTRCKDAGCHKLRVCHCIYPRALSCCKSPPISGFGRWTRRGWEEKHLGFYKNKLKMEKYLWALEDFECKASTFALKVKLYVPCAEKVNWKHGKFIKIQIKLLELKTTSGMKNTWNGINSRLNIAEEKISELKDSNWKLYKMKHRGKRRKKIDSSSVSFKWPDV